jgi:hypothetical protein
MIEWKICALCVVRGSQLMTDEEIKQMNDNTKELIRLMKVMQEVCNDV